jgi:hypothetical protein
MAEVDQYTTGPYDSLIALSGLNPGDACWIILDVDGIPQSLQAAEPAPGVLACKGMICAQGPAYNALLTVSGAALGINLQPRPDPRTWPP